MRRLLVLMYGALFFMASCSTENYNNSDFLAGEAFTDSNMRVVLIDTMTVETSTMKFDSIITSQASRMLVGKYTDSIFGTIQASSYVGLTPASYTIDSEAEYDSIVLHLKLDKYYYNDTLQTNTIYIKRLTKTLRPVEGDALYNTAVAEYSDANLGAISFNPRPQDSDTLEIKIDDELGMDFFKKFQEKEITGSDEFKDYFRGIALLPDENDDGSIIGFSKETEASFMRLYFSTSEESERVQSYIDIDFDLSSSPVPFFNQIRSEDPIEPLQRLVDKEFNLSSSESDDFSFIQSGVGIATRIQFPYVKKIYDLQGQGTIMDAILKIKPANNTFDDKLQLRDTLSVYVVDQNNDLTEQLLYGDVVPVTGILNRDNQEFNDIYYEISLGSYIETLLLAERETDEALILLPDDYASTVDRFILNGMDNTDFSVKLELTYAIYDEDND
ncbi:MULTISPECIES: DUF4270 family protein [Flavobacteriaceae]|uniref:DUF4270 family protein n=1 Tax=Flavobacteriaceae TaxID=49546 RepID=UPI001492B3EE|nr:MULTISPECIES: DUF4270 family protein [Allomuricauda]MDC6366955.1 DUF4270 family protein [Muricauda sp. AC10]